MLSLCIYYLLKIQFLSFKNKIKKNTFNHVINVHLCKTVYIFLCSYDKNCFPRMKVKSGLRLVSVSAANSRWAVTTEVKARAATVTATRLEQPLRDDDGLES